MRGSTRYRIAAASLACARAAHVLMETGPHGEILGGVEEIDDTAWTIWDDGDEYEIDDGFSSFVHTDQVDNFYDDTSSLLEVGAIDFSLGGSELTLDPDPNLVDPSKYFSFNSSLIQLALGSFNRVTSAVNADGDLFLDVLLGHPFMNFTNSTATANIQDVVNDMIRNFQFQTYIDGITVKGVTKDGYRGLTIKNFKLQKLDTIKVEEKFGTKFSGT